MRNKAKMNFCLSKGKFLKFLSAIALFLDYGASDDKQSNRVISEMDESFSRTNIFGSVNRSIISNEFGKLCINHA